MRRSTDARRSEIKHSQILHFLAHDALRSTTRACGFETTCIHTYIHTYIHTLFFPRDVDVPRAVDDVHRLEREGVIYGEETVMFVVKRRLVRPRVAPETKTRVIEDAAHAHDGNLVARVSETGGVFLQRGLEARGLVDASDHPLKDTSRLVPDAAVLIVRRALERGMDLLQRQHEKEPL